MRYISKGIVQKASTEKHLVVMRCGVVHELTELEAGLWLNGRFGFASVDEDVQTDKALYRLVRQELLELSDGSVGDYRALTQCVLVPAKAKSLRTPLSGKEKWALAWLVNAGLRLSMAELVFLLEHQIAPDENLIGAENRQELIECIYTRETIGDNILEDLMEKSDYRDETVHTVLSLLRKKRMILL